MNTLTMETQPTVALSCRTPQELIPPGFCNCAGQYRLVDNISLREGDTLISVPFMEPKEGRIIGAEMEERSQGVNLLAGQLHAQQLLGQVETLPQEWWGCVHLFLGTNWRGQLECRPIACLGEYRGRWSLFFRWLGDSFTPDCRLVQLQRKSLTQDWARSQDIIWA